MTELQKNTLDQLVGTLETLADFEEQRRYKRSVPFVHIPIELAEQWSNFPRLLEEKREWFTSLLSDDQIKAIREFEAIIGGVRFHVHFPDVEEVFELPSWVKVRDGAQSALEVF